MLKYCETGIVFREFPDEVTLAINLSNCPHRCRGCHSTHLQTDCGEELTDAELDRLVSKYGKSITCVGFMGGDGDIESLVHLFRHAKEVHPDVKVGWYSGNENIDVGLYGMYRYIDYIKVGHYDPDKGPLDSTTTNQKLYKKIGTGESDDLWEWVPMFK